MHVFTSTDGDKQTKEAFTRWLDSKQYVWTESGDEIRLFNLTEDDLARVNSCAGALFLSFTLCVAAPSVPVAEQDEPDQGLTWYQFTAVLAATTGKAYKLGELDTPVRWSMNRETGTFLFQVKRVQFNETVRRYNVTSTDLVFTKIYLENGVYQVDELRLPLPKVGDLVKFGGVTSPEEYWRRRVEAAAQVDWNKPGLAKALARETRSSKGA